jgi:hypothetical protein
MLAPTELLLCRMVQVRLRSYSYRETSPGIVGSRRRATFECGNDIPAGEDKSIKKGCRGAGHFVPTSHKSSEVCAALRVRRSRVGSAGTDASSAGAIYRLHISRASPCSAPDIGSIRWPERPTYGSSHNRHSQSFGGVTPCWP